MVSLSNHAAIPPHVTPKILSIPSILFIQVKTRPLSLPRCARNCYPRRSSQ